MARLTIHTTVDDADLAAYRGDLTEYLEARLDEVYGGEGTVLTTVHVTGTRIEWGARAVVLTPAALSLLSDLLDVNDDDDELAENSGATQETIDSLRTAVAVARADV